MSFILYHGDCLEQLKRLEDDSIDSIVTDPPYGLSFMGKKWDYDVPSVDIWAECLRVLKPGGHLLAFAGTRTQHRMAVRIEDAGFEIRDMIAWVYGSGFPKSHNVAQAIDREAGFNRGRIEHPRGKGFGDNVAHTYASDKWTTENAGTRSDPSPITEAAKQWQGWGTALKPALEPITVARKPLIGTVAANVLEHGTGALNIDAARVGTETRTNSSKACADRNGFVDGFVGGTVSQTHEHGRWPANLIHDGSDEVVGLFPVTGGGGKPKQKDRADSVVSFCGDMRPEYTPYADTANGGGSAARFFKSCPMDDEAAEVARFMYCAKASKKDRDEGLDGFDDKQAAGLPMRSSEGERGGEGLDGTKTDRLTVRKNVHPTVKPTDLMRYLCRLVTPPGGVVLDPFMGSGSTGKAARLEGFDFIGIERDAEYLEIAKARIESASQPKDLFSCS